MTEINRRPQIYSAKLTPESRYGTSICDHIIFISVASCTKESFIVRLCIPSATFTGKLLYPGDNYVKDFSGTADPNGRFVYHWTIGENGDVGELTIEAQVVASGYEPLEARSAFQITEG